MAFLNKGSLPEVDISDDSDSPVANSQFNASSLTTRPESPYPLVIPASPLTIIVDNYGRTLRSGAVYSTLIEARLFAGEGVVIFGPLAPVRTTKSWKQMDVVLGVTPSERLTWFNLLTAIEGVMSFVATFGTFAFSFEIRYQGSRSLRTGQMRMQS